MCRTNETPEMIVKTVYELLVSDKRDSLLLRITLEDSLCYIYDIIVESLLVPTGIYTTL